ncbi:LLM class flavin-dependent oxidoreductase [Bacillus alkalicellulosilyticus]|uniref:LLM class flavin-dependent oxidoreductase n=1 Tax=Alkalihalobacterium alkalicellulosilyticum TaxID=1912214 RepID=UPI000996AE9E|nr:LLM class flavin-dependent oxidoreductase [Bacillus alkalicellulosilyticus]
MKISILDQAPITDNETAYEALHHAVRLAQLGEKYGYTRYWIAEHHNLPGLACPAPEVMLPYIGAQTKEIRIGSGAILLPFYKTFKVAEVFNLLATLFPNRIDLGIGRAPGGSAETTNALSDHFLKQVWNMPDAVKELLQFLEDSFPTGHKYEKVTASPFPTSAPVPWILGTSKKSGILAGQLGVPYAFGQFMSENDGVEIIKQYFDSYRSLRENQKPEVIVTVSAICAETTERANELALSTTIGALQKENGSRRNGLPSREEAMEYKLTEMEKGKIERMRKNIVTGNPHELIEKLKQIQKTYQANEIMVVTHTHSASDRLRSYQLLGEEIKNCK